MRTLPHPRFSANAPLWEGLLARVRAVASRVRWQRKAAPTKAIDTSKVLPENRWLIELGKLTETLNMPEWKRRA